MEISIDGITALSPEVLIGIFRFIQNIKSIISLVKCCSYFRNILYEQHDGIVHLNNIRLSTFLKSKFRKLFLRNVILDDSLINNETIKRIYSCVAFDNNMLGGLISLDHSNITSVTLINEKYDVTFNKLSKGVIIRRLPADSTQSEFLCAEWTFSPMSKFLDILNVYIDIYALNHLIELFMHYTIRDFEDKLVNIIVRDHKNYDRDIAISSDDPTITARRLKDIYYKQSNNLLEIIWSLESTFLWNLVVTKINRIIVKLFIIEIISRTFPKSAQYIKLYVNSTEKESILSNLNDCIVIYYDNISFQQAIDDIDEVEKWCCIHALLIDI
jgi:hypothetical protein